MLKASSAVDLVEGWIPKQSSRTSETAFFFIACYSMARGKPSSQASVVQMKAPKTTCCQGCCYHRCWHPVLDTTQALWVTCLWATAKATSGGSATRMPAFLLYCQDVAWPCGCVIGLSCWESKGKAPRDFYGQPAGESQAFQAQRQVTSAVWCVEL